MIASITTSDRYFIVMITFYDPKTGKGETIIDDPRKINKKIAYYDMVEDWKSALKKSWGLMEKI